MTEVSLRKLNTHYYMSQADRAERRRLERLQLKVLDDAFELACERAGLPEDGELCLRAVSAPVRLRLDSSDQSIAAHWAAELSQCLADAIRTGPTSRRVFYYSRRQAVFDFALCVAHGDYERAWAWRLLGLWHSSTTVDGTGAPRELVQALTREPELIVPVLRHLGARGLLSALARKLSAAHWQELGEAALLHAGVVDARYSEEATPSSRVFSYALRILKRSQILAAISHSQVLAEAGETIRRALAGLAILEVEPALLQSQVAASVVTVVASSIDVANEDVAAGAASLPAESLSVKQETQHAFAEALEEQTPISDPRRRARTNYGGLLYLVHVIDLLELPEQILTDPVLNTRPLWWTLHQLAQALTPVGPTDAAALAFAGLSPDAPPPSETEPPPTEQELQAISLLATRIVAYVSSLNISEPELLDFVCRRKAEVVADPGWIEIHFSLDEVATEIRRAGLDLDPGYVKWLGVVLKFVYE